MIRFEKKYVIVFFLIFFIFCIFPNKSQAVTINQKTSGTSTAISELFTLVDSTSGSSLSTNGKCSFLDFWIDTNEDVCIICSLDTTAYKHSPNTITIGGVDIPTIDDYTSYTVTDADGEIKTYNETGHHYFLIKMDKLSLDFSQPFTINYDTGKGGFNVITTGKVKFYILVQDNIDGVLTIDWLQSKGNLTVGNTYRVNSNSYYRKEYLYLDLTIPNGSPVRYNDSYIDVIGTEGITTVVFYYQTEEMTRNIRIDKIWIDENTNQRPNSIRFTIIKNGIESNIHYDMNVTNENSYVFSGLDKYDENDEVILYGVLEQEVNSGDLDNYTSQINGDMINGFKIKNISKDLELGSRISITGPAQIENKYENIDYNIKFDVIPDINKTDNLVQIQIVDNLPCEIDMTKQNDFDGGTYNQTNKTITWNGIYNVSEKKIIWEDGTEENINSEYKFTIVKDISVFYKNLELINNRSIVNEVVGNVDSEHIESQTTNDISTAEMDLKVNVIIEKIWNDNENAGNSRPSELTVELYKDGIKYQDVILNEANNWKVEIDNLPQYGLYSTSEIEYTILESEIPMGYQSNIEKIVTQNNIKFELTNTLNLNQIDLPVTGGIGSVIYIVIGSVFIISSVFFKRYTKE